MASSDLNSRQFNMLLRACISASPQWFKWLCWPRCRIKKHIRAAHAVLELALSKLPSTQKGLYELHRAWCLNLFLPTVAHLHSAWNCFIGLSKHLERLVGASQVFHRGSDGFVRHSKHIKSLRFTRRLHWLKWPFPTFPIIQHVCTSITGLPEWFKWLCRTFQMPESVYISCTAPPQCLNWLWPPF